MHSQIVGQLTPDSTGFWNSAPVQVPYFDNQKLVVVFPELLEKDGLDSVDKALSRFLKLARTDKLHDTKQVYKNYQDSLRLPHTSPLKLASEQEIWLHVTPTEINVDWDEDEELYVIVNCECAWEEEHGLQLVFKEGRKLTRASGIDGHYTDDEDEAEDDFKKPWWKFW